MKKIAFLFLIFSLITCTSYHDNSLHTLHGWIEGGYDCGTKERARRKIYIRTYKKLPSFYDNRTFLLFCSQKVSVIFLFLYFPFHIQLDEYMNTYIFLCDIAAGEMRVLLEYESIGIVAENSSN